MKSARMPLVVMLFCLAAAGGAGEAYPALGTAGFKRPYVAIIIDDLGYDKSLARKIFSLDLALTVAIIPHAPHAPSIDAEAGARGYETIAHIPMEPENFPKADPGPGALLLEMDGKTIEKALEGNLARVPGARGASNHMGSAFTESREKMQFVLRFLKQKGMFFIDSLTSPDTVVEDTAFGLGMKFGERDVFLDNEQDPEAIERQLDLLLLTAQRQGSAIGIGHPYPETIEVLSMYRDELRTRFKMVPVSYIVDMKADGSEGGLCLECLE